MSIAVLAAGLASTAQETDNTHLDIMKSRIRIFLAGIAAVLAALGVILLAIVTLLRPGPEGRIVMAAGGSNGSYAALALLYKKDLARYGVNLELRPNVEGVDTLKALLSQYKSEFKGFDEKTADIEAGFVKGGFGSSLQGRYANERQQAWHERQVNGLRSVGRLFYEPLWVFVRADDTGIKSLRDLKGKKIYVGSPVSGNRAVSRHMLQANGVEKDTAVIIDKDFPEDGGPIISREADVAMMFLPAESPKIQRLLRNPKLRLMDFAAEAEAYAIRFPALSKVTLRQGSIEFNPDTPTTDITLLATSVALVVKSSLEPSLEALLAHAVIANPKSGFDHTGEPILFYKPGEFPTASDPEFVVSSQVRQIYKTGELPSLLSATSKALAKFGLPFWPSAFLFEHGTQTVLLIIPLLSILVPITHYVPILYRWGVRQRLLRRYQQLKLLERSIGEAPTTDEISSKLRELDRIDAAVSSIPVPLPFTDQLYDLRGHIDLVRRRLELMIPSARAPAE